MKCTHSDHKGKNCYEQGILMGHVSQEHLNPMLDDKREMLRTLDSIRQLCPKPKSRCSRTSSAMVQKPQKPSRSQQVAHLTPAPRARPQKQKFDAKSEEEVKILIKVWLEVRISILSPKDAYSGISQESLARISWFQPRPLKRVRPFSV